MITCYHWTSLPVECSYQVFLIVPQLFQSSVPFFSICVKHVAGMKWTRLHQKLLYVDIWVWWVNFLMVTVWDYLNLWKLNAGRFISLSTMPENSSINTWLEMKCKDYGETPVNTEWGHKTQQLRCEDMPPTDKETNKRRTEGTNFWPCCAVQTKTSIYVQKPVTLMN